MLVAVTVAVVATAKVITDIDIDYKTENMAYNNATSDNCVSELNYLDLRTLQQKLNYVLFNKSFCAKTAAVY